MQTMNLTSHQYTIALMLFLVAYSIFETPSNLALKIFSPKRYYITLHSFDLAPG